MRHQRAWATLRPLVVDGAPQQAATMLTALLRAEEAPGSTRVALLAEIAHAQVVAMQYDAAVATARLAAREATGRATHSPGSPALAAAVVALALTARGPDPASESWVLEGAVEVAGDLVLALGSTDPATPMACYCLAEAALGLERPAFAETVARRSRVAAQGPLPDAPGDVVGTLLAEQSLARALLGQDRPDEASVVADALVGRAVALRMNSLEALGHALRAKVAALADDTTAALRHGERAVALAMPSERSSIDTDAVVLVAHAWALLQRHVEAERLLVEAAGGPALPRLRSADRATGYTLLIDAAVATGRPDRAEAWRAHRQVLAPAVDTGAAASRPASGPSPARRLRIEAPQAEEAGAVQGHLQAQTQGRTQGRLPHDAGWGSLTPREREVAELAGRGLTNRQVAARLSVSERTVQTSLETVFRALGIRSRTMLPPAVHGLRDRTRSELPAPLTRRQAEVVALVADGRTNARIAEDLHMSVKTVEKHLRAVFARWGVSTRTTVAALWRSHQPEGSQTIPAEDGETA